MKTIVIIPAFNEAKVIRNVLRTVRPVAAEVLIIDDGSSDGTAEIAREEGAIVYQHMINRGLGGALGTGIAAALARGADIVVTFDADGQHEASDIRRLVEPIERGKVDAVIGSRLIEERNMPLRRKLYNRFANLITYALFGIKTSDSQSGLRAFSRAAASQLRIRTNKMEVSSEFMKEIHSHRLRVMEIAIKPIYTDYSMSKGQNFFVGMKTLVRLIVLRIMK